MLDHCVLWPSLATTTRAVTVAAGRFCPTAKALRDLRRRLGSAPVRALFEVLARSLARPVPFDGCSSQRVSDSDRNRAVGIEQEMWSRLALYQVLRTVTVDAAESVPGTDSDRCGFTIALQGGRDQVIQAADVVTTTVEPVGLIGAGSRRPRASSRKVKSPMSRYSGRHDDGRPDTSRTVTHLDVTILEPSIRSPHCPRPPGIIGTQSPLSTADAGS
ncbi:hypothetical protein ACWIG3_23100 [Streptomyces celluloflavus]